MTELARFVTFTLEPITGADKVSLARIEGTEWQCVTAKDQWEGKKLEGVYIGIDALLDVSIPSFEFLKDKANKVLSNGNKAHRLRTIRLRGVLSQGLLIPLPEDVSLKAAFAEGIVTPMPQLNTPVELTNLVSLDWDALLGIERWEPPVPKNLGGGQVHEPGQFERYTGIENAKNHPGAFTEGEEVEVTEKIHGSNFRVGVCRIGDVATYMVGSHSTSRDPAGVNLFSREARRLFPEELMRWHFAAIGATWQFIVYGEVFGSGVQDLTYGLAPNKTDVRIFDAKVDGVFVPRERVAQVAEALAVGMVPVLYRGPYSRETVMALRDGPTTLTLDGGKPKHVREGVVVRGVPEARFGTHKLPGRKILKFISDSYLERSNQKDGH